LKEASPSFVVMRRLATRFRGLLQGANPSNLDRFFMAPDDLAFPHAGIRKNAHARH
jgi:hypothetical protein